MRISLMSIPLLFAFAIPANPQSPSVMPLMSSVEPVSARGGDLVTVQGTNLGQDRVAELYLTDGKVDVKMEIVEQTATSIKFKLPVEAKPGRFALMILTRDQNPKLIEQPVKLTVEPQTTSAAERLERHV